MSKETAYISSTYYKEVDPSVETVMDHIVGCADLARLPTSPYKVGPIGQLIAPQIPIQVIFVYPPAAVEVLPPEHLRLALGHALNDYPHLTGRLVIGDNGVLTVAHFGEGALFREAQCSQTLASLAGSPSSSCLSLLDLPCGGNALLPPLPVTPETVAEAPPLVVQHTRFACGGVALAIRILHTLCDGAGFFQFAQDLVWHCNAVAAKVGGSSTVASSLSRPPPPPHLTAYLSGFATMSPPEVLAAARAYDPPLLQLAPLPPPGPQPTPPPPPEIQGRELTFTAAQLAAIKQQCTSQDGGSWVSTFEALGAFLATHIYQVRHERLNMPGAHYYLSPVDIRARVLPSSPERYFPVGVISACGPLPEEALSSGALPTVAAAIHNMIRSEHLSEPALQQQLRWVAAQETPSRVCSKFQYGGFMLSAWNKFDMYGGMRLSGVAPVFVGTPFTRISLLDGLAYVLPHPKPLPSSSTSASSNTEAKVEVKDNGAVVVAVALNTLLWEKLSTAEHLGTYMKSVQEGRVSSL